MKNSSQILFQYSDDDMQSLASLISMNGPDPTPDLDDDDQNPQLFKYSDQTQNEISEMIEQFNNQFLNTDDNLVENVGDQHEQRQNFPTDKREIVQNGIVSSYFSHFFHSKHLFHILSYTKFIMDLVSGK